MVYMQEALHSGTELQASQAGASPSALKYLSLVLNIFKQN